MTTIEMLLQEPIFQALGWALVHFIWQGAVVAALYASVNYFLRRRAASVRYATACAALGVMLILPAITIIVLSRSSSLATAEVSTGVEASQAYSAVAPAQAVQARPDSRAILQSDNTENAEAAVSNQLSVKQWVEERLPVVFPWLVAFWFAGVLFLSLRFLGGLFVAHRLKRREVHPTLQRLEDKLASLVKTLRVSRPVRLCESALVEVPTVIGWLRPVILFPASALTGLSPEQLEALLAHELAHIRRYDYLINLLQTAVETLLFYHPAVWWISGKIREEREHCCDDLAVAACGNVLVYARALAELEQLRISPPQLAVAANGGSLLHRIQRLVGKSARSSHRFESGLAGAIAIFIVFFMLAGAQTSILSQNTAQASTASPEDKGIIEAQSAKATRPLQPGLADRDKESHKSEDAFEANQSEEQEKPQSSASNIEQQTEQAASTEQGAAAGEPQDFIGALEALGYTKLSVDNLVSLKNQGVTPEFIRQINALFNQKLPVDDLVSMRIHGVGPEFINNIRSLGYNNISADDLVAFRIHGVTPEFISAWKNHGYDLSADDLVAFRIHGVSQAVVQAMKEIGYDRLEADDLIAMRIHGVSPQFIQTMKQHVRGTLSIDDLTAMRIHGVTPEYIKQIDSLGYGNLTADKLVGMRIHGVTPRFIEAVQGQGFKPTVDQLVGMRIFGVTPEFIQTVKERGFNDVTINQLIELRRLNIIPGSRKK